MIVALDLETTGLDKYNDQIIEVALIKFDENTFETKEVFSSFVNPGIPVPDIISNMTNIFDEDVLGAPTLDELKVEILDFIGDTPLLGHNVFFDRDFFIEKGIDIRDNIVLDTFFLANIFCIHEKSLNLEMLTKSFGIGFDGAHRAINDVKATIKLFEALLKLISQTGLDKKVLIKYIFTLSDDKSIEYLKNLIFSNIKETLTFDIFEKQLLQTIGIFKTIDLDEEARKKQKIPKISESFKALGTLEKRENQLKMSELMLVGFKKGQQNVIEAPTGLGKSFAYLIPAIHHSIKTGEKVFISTKTKNLQDQLYMKDLSFLYKKLGLNFNYCKLKGRSNYISIHGLMNEITLDDINYTKVNFLSKIIFWLHETIYGELDELNYFGQEYGFLKFISADSSFILQDSNEYLEYEFLYKARTKLNSSQIVIVNHSLLFSDIKADNSVLGTIKNLVIDEAHNIEDSVTDSLKVSVNEKILLDMFGFIEKILQKKKQNKIDFINQKEFLLLNLDLIFDYGASYINGKVPSAQNYKNTLITEDFFENIELSLVLKKIEGAFIDISDILSTIQDHDFASEISFLNNYLITLKTILKVDNTHSYIKIASSNERDGVSLVYTLLNPGNYLKTTLWDNIGSVTLTSATLKIGDSFEYFNKILSLEDFNFHSFDSDFDYAKQSTLFVPTDIGNIKNNSVQVVKFLQNFFAIVKGKTLTLLTSFSIIRTIYTSMNMSLKKQGIHLLPQSIGGSKTKLLNFFLDTPDNSILLGTDSFWEGVDIPGENLKYLVIHKFPFHVPTDPIFQARSVFFQDPFREYSIPRAIIKLKQGFGRLIRSKSDTGIVILLDDRIYSSNWGKDFIKAFPDDINVKYTSSQSFFDVLEKNINK